MSWNPTQSLVWIIVVSFTVVGCSPSRPLYLRDTGDLSYYLETATDIEYPDVETVDLEEVTQAKAPITVIDPDFESYYDLTLEQCVSMALQNAKVLRGYGTPNIQQSRVTPGIDDLSNGPAAAGTVYNVAIRETEPGFIGTPGQISAPGSVLTNTGLDVNQGVEAALADFDAQFTTSAFWTKSDEPRNVDPTIINNPNINPFDRLVFQQDQVQWQSELSKKTANGTQLFFRNVNVYTANNTPLVADQGFQNLDSWYRTALEFEIRQPLMRGRGAFIQRMPIMVSRINTDQELANFDAQLQNMVTNIEIRYWDLSLAYRRLDASKVGRNAALDTWRILNDQFQIGADVNKQQVAQSAEQYHFFDAQVTESFNNLLLAENSLRWLIGIASTDGLVIRPTDEAIISPIEFDFHQAQYEALSFRPELRQLLWEVRKKYLAVGYSKNALLPEFNISALYRVLGLGNFYSTSQDNAPNFADPNSGAWNDLFGNQFQEFQLGVDFRAPIGFRRELSNVRNAELKLARELARVEDMKLDITRQVTTAVQAVATNRKLMQQHFNRWKNTFIEKEHFEELEQAGHETLSVALDAQRRHSEAEVAYYSAVCEYNKTLAVMHRRKGTILAYNNISMAEGPWPGKAYQDATEYARRRSSARPLNYGWTRPEVISRGPNTPTIGGQQETTIEMPQSRESIMNVPFETMDSTQEMIDDAGSNLPAIPTPAELDQNPQTNVQPILNGYPTGVSPTETGVRQVSYEEFIDSPQTSSPKILTVTQSTQRQPSKPRMTAAINPARRSNDPNNAQRLPKTTSTASALNTPKPNVKHAKLDWSKFGLSAPKAVAPPTRAIIKHNNE